MSTIGRARRVGEEVRRRIRLGREDLGGRKARTEERKDDEGGRRVSFNRDSENRNAKLDATRKSELKNPPTLLRFNPKPFDPSQKHHPLWTTPSFELDDPFEAEVS